MAGKPITGVTDVTFALYTEEAGGVALWYETQTIETDALGRYTVLLGAMHAAGVPVELFTSGQARWLGVGVGNLPETAQGGRVLLVSVPYALKAQDAETLGGKPASAFMLAANCSGDVSSPSCQATGGSPASPAAPGAATANLAGTKGKTQPKPLAVPINTATNFVDTTAGPHRLGRACLHRVCVLKWRKARRRPSRSPGPASRSAQPPPSCRDHSAACAASDRLSSEETM